VAKAAAATAWSGTGKRDFIHELSEKIHKVTGIQLGDRQRVMVETRLQKRVIELSLKDLEAYAAYFQTQQVIRSLSKMAVEARKQLQGQGQVTENEARAVEKADSGNIDDITTGELQDLVTLTKRAAYYTAKSHQEFLSTMEQNEGTRGAAPFYKVRGLEPLLSHEPKLPQIGGGGDVRSQADAILKGK
jgi:hypothetical protein